MPQFDFYSFSGQNFWILTSFFLFYFFTVYFYLANFSEMFKMRQKLMSVYANKFETTKISLLNLFDYFMFLKPFKS
jgi:hypothetical protein